MYCYSVLLYYKWIEWLTVDHWWLWLSTHIYSTYVVLWQSLRNDLLSGKLSATLLVNLSPADLATDELRKSRQEIEAVEAEAHRSDWFQEHKEKICEDSGIDPENNWEYSDDDVSLASQFWSGLRSVWLIYIGIVPMGGGVIWTNQSVNQTNDWLG